MLPSPLILGSILIRFSITHCICVTGPTSFAPIIEMAMTIVEQSGGQYHVLLIIADGQVYLVYISYKKEHSFIMFKYAQVIKYFI